MRTLPTAPLPSAAWIGAFALIALQILCLLPGCELVLEGTDTRSERERAPFVVTQASVGNDEVGVPVNQPLVLTFSEYLDANSFEYFNALDVRSGSIRGRGRTRYSAVDKSLTFFPTRAMRPGLIYTLTVSPENVRSVFGEELLVDFSVRFETGDLSVDQERRITSLSFERDITPIFEAGCSCHQQDPSLASLRYGDLVGVASSQLGDRLLVLPFEPADSYLLQKLLPDYPNRLLEPMPPSWSSGPELSLADLRAVEHWIAGGAEP